jgi:hypothetical protein
MAQIQRFQKVTPKSQNKNKMPHRVKVSIDSRYQDILMIIHVRNHHHKMRHRFSIRNLASIPKNHHNPRNIISSGGGFSVVSLLRFHSGVCSIFSHNFL